MQQEFDPLGARFKYRSPAVGVKVAGAKFQLTFASEGEYVRFCRDYGPNYERSEPNNLTRQPGNPGNPGKLFNQPEGPRKLNALPHCEAGEPGKLFKRPDGPSGPRNSESSGFFSQSIGWGSQVPTGASQVPFGASQVPTGASQVPIGASHDWRHPVHASFSPDTTGAGTEISGVNSEFLAQILNEPSEQLRASVIAKLGDPRFIEKVRLLIYRYTVLTVQVEQIEQILKGLR